MFGTSSRTVFYWPALYYWLLKYKGLMVSKVTICLELPPGLCSIGQPCTSGC